MAKRPMSRAEGLRRLPQAREFVLMVACSVADKKRPRKELVGAVEYYREVVAATERGREIQ